MRKNFKFLTYILSLFTLINIFISFAFADIMILPCRPWQDPDKDFCSSRYVINSDIQDADIDKDDQVIVYSISWIMVIIIAIISWVILIKIKKKNVK